MLNESIIKIRCELQKLKLKKSGKNSYAGFDYYELADFLPKLNELMQVEKINDIFTIEDSDAKLILVKGEEKNEYKMPFKIFDTPVNSRVNQKTGEVKEVKSMQDIQYLGALNTYYKRYLYLNAFGITDGEIIDSMNNDEVSTKSVSKQTTTGTMITQNQIELINKLFTQEELLALLPKVKKTKVEELTLVEASNLIKTKKKVEDK